MKTNRKYGINNGRRAIEAIKAALFIIDGYINQIEYNLTGFTSDDNKAYLNAILMGIDPFTNNELFDILTDMYDLQSPDGLRAYFTLPIKCLLRIEQSIQLWTKNNGVSGYFDFLENHLGNAVPSNDKMEYIIEASPKVAVSLIKETEKKS